MAIPKRVQERIKDGLKTFYDILVRQRDRDRATEASRRVNRSSEKSIVTARTSETDAEPASQERAAALE